MLLDLSTLPFDMPTLPDPTSSVTHLEEDLQLNFDDLLDIAREFEFTRTITHIWPCEEEPSMCPETGLESIFAVIVPTPNAEESPLPLPSSVLQVDLVHSSTSICPASDANAGVLPPSKDDHQVRIGAEPPVTSILRGWSPPDGSQSLDLDDSLMLPRSPRDVWIPPWLATFLAPSCTQSASSTSHPPATIPTIGDMQLQTTEAEPRDPLVGMAGKTADDPKRGMSFVSLPVQASTCAILEPVPARSALQTNSNIPSQTAIIPHVKIPKSRPQLLPIPATGGAFTMGYAKAPRGGIPPHIARTVTKANILHVEKERKVMRDAFSSATTGEGKKPSVLRRAAKVERETSKVVHGGGSGKKPFSWGENGEKEGRVAKKARV